MAPLSSLLYKCLNGDICLMTLCPKGRLTKTLLRLIFILKSVFLTCADLRRTSFTKMTTCKIALFTVVPWGVLAVFAAGTKVVVIQPKTHGWLLTILTLKHPDRI